MAEMLAAFPEMFSSAGAAGAGSAIPSGMATAGGMASGVGTAGAVGAGSAIPEALSSLGSGFMKGAMPVLSGNLASALLSSGKQNFPAPRPLGASFSMTPPQIPGAGVRPVPAIGSGGNDASGAQLEMLLRALKGGR